MNVPNLLLRPKTKAHPKGRANGRFIKAMRGKTEIIGVSKFSKEALDEVEELEKDHGASIL